MLPFCTSQELPDRKNEGALFSEVLGIGLRAGTLVYVVEGTAVCSATAVLPLPFRSELTSLSGETLACLPG